MRLANCLHASGVWSALALYRSEVQAVCDIVKFLTMGAGEWGNELFEYSEN